MEKDTNRFWKTEREIITQKGRMKNGQSEEQLFNVQQIMLCGPNDKPVNGLGDDGDTIGIIIAEKSVPMNN